MPGFLPWVVIMGPCHGLQEPWWTEGRSAGRGGLEPPFSEPSQGVLHEVLLGKVHANSERWDRQAAHSKVNIILLESRGKPRCTRAHSPFATPRLFELLQSFTVFRLGQSPST